MARPGRERGGCRSCVPRRVAPRRRGHRRERDGGSDRRLDRERTAGVHGRLRALDEAQPQPVLGARGAQRGEERLREPAARGEPAVPERHGDREDDRRARRGGPAGQVAVMRKVAGRWQWVEYTRAGSRYGVLAQGSSASPATCRRGRTTGSSRSADPAQRESSPSPETSTARRRSPRCESSRTTPWAVSAGSSAGRPAPTSGSRRAGPSRTSRRSRASRGGLRRPRAGRRAARPRSRPSVPSE